MRSTQKVIKYVAMAFAILLTVGIITAIIEIISLFAGGIGGWNEADISEYKTFDYAIVETIKLDAHAGSYIIETGDVDEIQISYNRESIDVSMENDTTLKIKSDKFMFRGSNNEKIKIIIPKAMDLKKLDLDIGVGEIEVSNIETAIGKINLGVGSIKVKNSTMVEGSIDLGIGEINFTGRSDNLYLDNGIGEITATIIGNIDDYSVKADAGLGDETVNNNSSGNYSNSSAEKKIVADLGIGDIKITFQDE